MLHSIPSQNQPMDFQANARLIRAAKNLAWELKPETPLFDNQTMDMYWATLSRETKLRYVGAVEMLLKSLVNEIDGDKASLNTTRMWLESIMI